MIIFKPSAEIKKRFKDIDFKSLSMVYSLLLSSVEKGKKKQSKIYTINLYYSKKTSSYYYFKRDHITFGSDVQTTRAFHVSLLHEFRHFCQDRCLKIPFTVKNYNDATYSTYMNSPIEIDANNYTTNNIARVMQYYKRIVSLRNKFAEFSDYTGNKV
jgi:hypothetical protein